MRLFYALVALLCLQLQPASAQEDAKQFLRDTYLTYVEGDGNGVPLEGPELRKTFTEELAGIIDADAKKGDLKRMSYDPLADAEEWDITDLRISIRPISPTHVMGNVAFLNFEEAAMVNVDLVKTQDGWRIDDIQVPDGRLRDLFKGPDPLPEPPTSGDAGPAEATPEPPIQTATPAEVKPVEEAQPVEEAKPVEQATPAEETKPVEAAKPAEETKPAEAAIKPVEEAKPVEASKPVEATKPAEVTKPKKVAKPKKAAKPKLAKKPATPAVPAKQAEQAKPVKPVKTANPNDKLNLRSQRKIIN